MVEEDDDDAMIAQSLNKNIWLNGFVCPNAELFSTVHHLQSFIIN